MNVERTFVRANLDHEICMKLPDGCGDMSENNFWHDRSPHMVYQKADGFGPLLVETVVDLGME